MKQYHLTRIAIITHQANCQNKKLSQMIREVNTQYSMHSYTLCLQGGKEYRVEILYALRRAIELKMTACLLLLSVVDSTMVMEVAEKLDILEENHIWVTINLPVRYKRSLTDKYPRTKINNVIVEHDEMTMTAHEGLELVDDMKMNFEEK